MFLAFFQSGVFAFFQFLTFIMDGYVYVSIQHLIAYYASSINNCLNVKYHYYTSEKQKKQSFFFNVVRLSPILYLLKYACKPHCTAIQYFKEKIILKCIS